MQSQTKEKKSTLEHIILDPKATRKYSEGEKKIYYFQKPPNKQKLDNQLSSQKKQ